LPLKWFQKASTISRTASMVGMIIWRIAYQKNFGDTTVREGHLGL